MAILLILQVIVACWEKRKVWPYSDMQETLPPRTGDYASYVDRWVADAQQQGFTLLGWVTDTREKYNIRTAFLVAPDHDCIAAMSEGTLFGMVVRGTLLHTLTDGDRLFYTTDTQNLVEFDVTGKAISQLASVTSFAELWQKHQSWIQEKGIRAEHLPQGGEVARWRQYREEKYRAMAEKKWIAFTDNTATIWRYTFLGACYLAVGGYFIGLLRGMTGGKFPKSA